MKKRRAVIELVTTCIRGNIFKEEDLDAIILICQNATVMAEKEYNEHMKTAAEAHEGLE